MIHHIKWMPPAAWAYFNCQPTWFSRSLPPPLCLPSKRPLNDSSVLASELEAFNGIEWNIKELFLTRQRAPPSDSEQHLFNVSLWGGKKRSQKSDLSAFSWVDLKADEARETLHPQKAHLSLTRARHLSAIINHAREILQITSNDDLYEPRESTRLSSSHLPRSVFNWRRLFRLLNPNCSSFYGPIHALETEKKASVALPWDSKFIADVLRFRMNFFLDFTFRSRFSVLIMRRRGRYRGIFGKWIFRGWKWRLEGFWVSPSRLEI